MTTGLGAEFWFSVVKWIGVSYLAFLGVMLLRSKGTLDESLRSASGGGAGSARSIFLKSFLVAVTNLKGYLFFSAFLPQFIDPAARQIQQYVAAQAAKSSGVRPFHRNAGPCAQTVSEWRTPLRTGVT